MYIPLPACNGRSTDAVIDAVFEGRQVCARLVQFLAAAENVAC